MLILIFLLGAVLRVLAARGDFWFDEILTVFSVRRARFIAQLIFNYSDNNHLLNSLCMYPLSRAGDYHLLRLPALLAGIATPAAAYVFGAERGRVTGVLTMLLVACSYPLVVYGSEARGYSMEILLAILAVVTLEQLLAVEAGNVERGEIPLLPHLLFAGYVLLGAAAHLSFVPLYLAMVIWSIYRLRRVSPATAIRRGVMCHGLPIAALAIYYWFIARHLRVAGAPPRPLQMTLAESWGYALGLVSGPVAAVMHSEAAYVAAAIGVAAAVACIASLYARNDDRWLLYSLVIFVCPLAFLVEYRLRGIPTQGIYPRYFLVPILFFLLLIGEQLGQLWKRARGAVVLIAATLCLANLYQTASFLPDGRGSYSRAVAFIVSQSRTQDISIAGTDDFRLRPMLRFYGYLVPPGTQMGYVTQDERNQTHHDADWLIDTNVDPTHVPLPQLPTVDGSWFILQQIFPAAGPSGWSWYVYRRMGA